MKAMVFLAAVAAAVSASAQSAQGRDDFMRQQAYAEMQRVVGRVDVIQSNVDDVARRVSRLENSKNEIESLRAEVVSMKAAISELRRQMEAMRGEIVSDLSKRVAAMQPPRQPQARQPAEPQQRVVAGPHYEYTVKSGDSLFLIAKAFNTTVSKIKELNGLKGDNLKVGQKLNVPKE